MHITFRNLPQNRSELLKFAEALKIPKVTHPPKKSRKLVKELLKRFTQIV